MTPTQLNTSKSGISLYHSMRREDETISGATAVLCVIKEIPSTSYGVPGTTAALVHQSPVSCLPLRIVYIKVNRDEACVCERGRESERERIRSMIQRTIDGCENMSRPPQALSQVLLPALVVVVLLSVVARVMSHECIYVCDNSFGCARQPRVHRKKTAVSLSVLHSS